MDTVDNAGRAAAEPVGRVRAFKNIPYCARCTYELSATHSVPRRFWRRKGLRSHANAKSPNFCRSCTGRAAPSPRMRGLGVPPYGTSTLVSREVE